MTQGKLLGTVLVAALVGCTEVAVAPDVSLEASLAKGGPSVVPVADFTITDGFSLVSDGKGIYRHDVCGVVGWAGDGRPSHLGPAEGKIAKSQQASCVGIAPRKASVTLAVRHVSDNPHIDDSASPTGSGTFNVGNVKFGWGDAMATTVNAGNGSPMCGTLGLRFTPVTFPGTSSVVRDDLGNGLWHMFTRPYPDNVGYCENSGVIAYWHVSMDMYVQVR